MESPHLRVLLPNMGLEVQSRDRLVANLTIVRHLPDGFDVGSGCPSCIDEWPEQGDERRPENDERYVRRRVRDDYVDKRSKPEKERGYRDSDPYTVRVLGPMGLRGNDVGVCGLQMIL